MNDFSVDLSGSTIKRKGWDKCSAINCTGTATKLATLTYCWCDMDKHEHGHPGTDNETSDRHYVKVCWFHGSTMLLSWESLEDLEDL